MTTHVPFPTPETARSHHGPSAGMVAAYERYFRVDVCHKPYPRANPCVLSWIRKLLPEGGHVVDYGFGSGRYLFAVRGHAKKAAGFDVSPAAFDLLSVRANEAPWPDLGVLGPDPEALENHCAPAPTGRPTTRGLCARRRCGCITSFKGRRGRARSSLRQSCLPSRRRWMGRPPARTLNR